VVVHAGEDLQLGGVLQQDATHHVHLPQLHRTIALPPTELIAPLAPSAKLDQAMALQAPVDGRSGGRRLDSLLAELVLDASRAPARVLPAQLADLAASSTGICCGQVLGRWDRSARAASPSRA
jgi:hypothetical protein